MLTQSEANYLLQLLKRLVNTQTFDFPQSGDYKTLEVVSAENKEHFILDVSRKGKIRKTKCTYQKRYRKEDILLRLCVDGRPHTNPDGETIECPHLHIYKEGHADRWAYRLPDGFTATDNLISRLFEFLEYCKVENGDELTVQGVVE